MKVGERVKVVKLVPDQDTSIEGGVRHTVGQEGEIVRRISTGWDVRLDGGDGIRGQYWYKAEELEVVGA